MFAQVWPGYLAQQPAAGGAAVRAADHVCLRHQFAFAGIVVVAIADAHIGYPAGRVVVCVRPVWVGAAAALFIQPASPVSRLATAATQSARLTAGGHRSVGDLEPGGLARGDRPGTGLYPHAETGAGGYGQSLPFAPLYGNVF